MACCPEQWLSSTFIPIPKKTNARKHKDHRLINLMSHFVRILLKIINMKSI